MPTLRDYAAAVARVAPRAAQSPRAGREERLVFVVGCPRSGTTFLGGALGSLPGFVDLGEVTPWKAVLPSAPAARGVAPDPRARAGARSGGGLRGVEQTPETAFALVRRSRRIRGRSPSTRSATAGTSSARCSSAAGSASRGRAPTTRGTRTVRQPRFWVEPERREEFSRVSGRSPLRLGVAALRRGRTQPVNGVQGRVLEVRYESLPDAAERLAGFLDADETALRRALSAFRDSSIGRWRRDLTAEQLADVEAEAGGLLAELGYG